MADRLLRVVADTNILISAVIAKGNEYALLSAAKTGRLQLVLSLQIIKEFTGVISRPKFGFSKAQIDSAIKHIISISEIVATTAKVQAVKEDPDDNKIIEAAIDGKADYIASGDKDLLRLKNFDRIKIAPATEILKLLKK